jgi:hypothetical protein
MAFQRMSSQTMKRTLGLDVAPAQGEGKVADSRTTERRIGFIVSVLHEVLVLRY